MLPLVPGLTNWARTQESGTQPLAAWTPSGASIEADLAEPIRSVDASIPRATAVAGAWVEIVEPVDPAAAPTHEEDAPAAMLADAAAQRAGAPARSPRATIRREAAESIPTLARGPEHLAVPLHAESLVDEQFAVARRNFSGMGRRTQRYFPMIERTLARRGLPDELKYVAVIESALNPDAESHAGASGLWQFMPETGAEFGLDSLTVLDPARATDAAARYLKRLHRQFRGDWQLAIAAYNSGPGRVGRLVQAYQSEHGSYPTFWDIHADLPRETQDYVPRFIAVTRMFEPRAAR